MQFAGNADSDKIPVHKTRYSLNWKNHFYEIDLYPFWKDQAILEVPLRDEEEEVMLPDFLRVIREVTGERKYEIAVLADRHKTAEQ